MKSYEVHRVRISYGINSTEKLRKKTEELLNQKSAAGYQIEKVDFELGPQGGYIFAFVVVSK